LRGLVLRRWFDRFSSYFIFADNGERNVVLKCWIGVELEFDIAEN
jgi:hypothetical protein